MSGSPGLRSAGAHAGGLAGASGYLVIGAGGHGRVVADVVRSIGHLVVGFVDHDPRHLHRPVHGEAGVIMLQSSLLETVAADGRLPDGVTGIALGIGDNVQRLETLRALGPATCPTLVHPAAVVSPSAWIGPGTVVMAGAIVNAGARIGIAVIVNTGAIVEHDCEVGDGAHLSPRATLAGAVGIGERAWLGAGATVIPRCTIGADAVVGAGAVVIRDVEAGTTVVGVPARPLAKDMASPPRSYRSNGSVTTS